MATPFRLMVLAPGHFHAALVSRAAPPDVHRRIHVYAPFGGDVIDYMTRVGGYNARADSPTAWELDVRTGPGYLARFARELPGQAAVVAGRNDTKIDHVLAAASAPCHVLADKPWVIRPDAVPKLEEAVRQADLREVLLWDMMTGRFETTTRLQRDVMRDVEVYGEQLLGTADDPALTLDSTHHLKKAVSGVPLRRPAWWFDPDVAGNGLEDAGAHLADLALWLLFPDLAVGREAVGVIDASVWPTAVSLDQFAELTGLPAFPPALHARTSGDSLLYQGNGTALFTAHGVHVRMTTNWDVEPPEGGSDTHEATARGSRAAVTVRPTPGHDGRTRHELFVTANDPTDHAAVRDALARRCRTWAARWPGVMLADHGTTVQVHVPDRHRTGHEQHFMDVFAEFRRHCRNPRRAPAWEAVNLVTKYHITTAAGAMARGKLSPPA